MLNSNIYLEKSFQGACQTIWTRPATIQGAHGIACTISIFRQLVQHKKEPINLHITICTRRRRNLHGAELLYQQNFLAHLSRARTFVNNFLKSVFMRPFLQVESKKDLWT